MRFVVSGSYYYRKDEFDNFCIFYETYLSKFKKSFITTILSYHNFLSDKFNEEKK
jgi:hypothetical protein